jgi:hypothetical protein
MESSKSFFLQSMNLEGQRSGENNRVYYMYTSKIACCGHVCRQQAAYVLAVVLQCTNPSLGTEGRAAAEKMQVNMTQALVTDFHMLQPGNLLENHCGSGSIQPIQTGIDRESKSETSIAS